MWNNARKQLKLLHSIQESNKGIEDAALMYVTTQDKAYWLGGNDRDISV